MWIGGVLGSPPGIRAGRRQFGITNGGGVAAAGTCCCWEMWMGGAGEWVCVWQVVWGVEGGGGADVCRGGGVDIHLGEWK